MAGIAFGAEKPTPDTLRGPSGAHFFGTDSSGMDVLSRVMHAPRIDINPGIVRVRTRLKTPVARLALANSIALTPGSLVVEIEGDTLFIHWLDVTTTDTEEASRIFVEPFEEHLEKTFG